jgi:hypothetical protein
MPSRSQCPHKGALFYCVGVVGLIIFFVGKNISRMAQKRIPGKNIAVSNILLAVTLLVAGTITLFYLYFCLTF